MIIPSTIIEQIETSKFDLDNMMEEIISILDSKCLVYVKKDCKNESIDTKINQNILSEVKDTLNKINVKFMEIVDLWTENSTNDDLLIVFEEFKEFKSK